MYSPCKLHSRLSSDQLPLCTRLLASSVLHLSKYEMYCTLSSVSLSAYRQMAGSNFGCPHFKGFGHPLTSGRRGEDMARLERYARTLNTLAWCSDKYRITRISPCNSLLLHSMNASTFSGPCSMVNCTPCPRCELVVVRAYVRLPPRCMHAALRQTRCDELTQQTSEEHLAAHAMPCPVEAEDDWP